MKKITFLTLAPTAAITALAFSSCASSDPEYRAWKAKQKEASSNPYGVAEPPANPYGVPQSGGETAAYTPTSPAATPYQPLPVITQQAVSSPAPYTPPRTTSPAAGGSNHTIVPGDSLWALARKYDTSVEAIQSANGLTSTVIRTGQSLIIPAN